MASRARHVARPTGLRHDQARAAWRAERRVDGVLAACAGRASRAALRRSDCAAGAFNAQCDRGHSSQRARRARRARPARGTRVGALHARPRACRAGGAVCECDRTNPRAERACAGHGVQASIDVAALAPLYVPAAHSVHSLLPSVDHEPAGHCTHSLGEVALLRAEEVPARHGVHSEDPRDDQNPGGHTLHVDSETAPFAAGRTLRARHHEPRLSKVHRDGGSARSVIHLVAAARRSALSLSLSSPPIARRVVA